MDQFLNSLPKTVIAIGAMVLGLVFFRIVQPPRTVCDAQLEIFRDSQKKFLYSPTTEEGATIKQSTLIKRTTDVCMNDNSPGGCFELFEGLKKMAVDLDNIPDQCMEKVAEEEVVKRWLWTHLKLMTQLAWGSRAPASYMQRNGWFDASEISLFCNLRHQAIRIYGYEQFDQWQKSEVQKFLPGAEKFTFEQLWQRSLISSSCGVYH